MDKRRAFGLNDYDDAVKVVNLVLKKIVEFKFSPENLLLEGSHSQGSLEEKECHGAVSNPQKSLGRPLTQGSLNGVLNVNIPDLAYNDIKGFTGATLGRRIYDKQVVEQIDPRGRPYYWIGGGGEDIEEIPGTDCQYLRDGYVTLTVLGPDHVLHRGQESLHLLATELNNKKRL